MSCFSLAKLENLTEDSLLLATHVRPIQNWIRERVRGVSDHQERPKAFSVAYMNRMIITYMHTVQGKRL